MSASPAPAPPPRRTLALLGPAARGPGLPWVLQAGGALFLALGFIVFAPYGGLLALTGSGADAWDAAAEARADALAVQLAQRNQAAFGPDGAPSLEACCVTDRPGLVSAALLDTTGAVLAPAERKGSTPVASGTLLEVSRSRTVGHATEAGDLVSVAPIAGPDGAVQGYAWVRYDADAARPVLDNPLLRAVAALLVTTLSAGMLVAAGWWLAVRPLLLLRDDLDGLAESGVLHPPVRGRTMESLVHALNRAFRARE